MARVGFSMLRLLMGALVLLPFTYMIGTMIGEGLNNDLVSSGSSIATRATMTIFSLQTVLHHPLGVGFAGFYPAIARYLPDAMHTARSIFDFPLIFTEVSNYQYTMENADCKTFVFDFLTYFGLPFAAAFFIFFVHLIKRLFQAKQQVLLVGALFSALALLTYYSSMNTYSIPVMIGVCLSSTSYAETPLR